MVTGDSSTRQPSATYGVRLHDVRPEKQDPKRGENGVGNIAREASGNKIT